MDALSQTPGLTHTELRASLKRSDARLANAAFSPLSPSEAVYNARMREVYHLGIRLCDARICSAEAIDKLVGKRIQEINNETAPFLPNVLEADEGVKNPDTKLQEWMADAGVGRIANLAGVLEVTQGAYKEELKRISTRVSYGPSAIDASAPRKSVLQVPSTPPQQEIEYPDTESGNTPVIPSTIPLPMDEDDEMPDTQPGEVDYPDTQPETEPGESFYLETEAPVSFYPQTEPGDSFYPDTEPGDDLPHPNVASSLMPQERPPSRDLERTVAPEHNYEHEWEADSEESRIHIDTRASTVVLRVHAIDHQIRRAPIDVFEDSDADEEDSPPRSRRLRLPYRPLVNIAPRPASLSPRSAGAATGAFASTYQIRNPLRRSPNSPELLSFRQVEREFQETLDGYGEEYGGEEEASADHFEFKDALEDGIRQARRPQRGFTPEQLWDDVERTCLVSARREKDRRERIANGGWKQRSAKELFGPEADDKPDMEEMWKEMAAKTKRINEARKMRGDVQSSSPQYIMADARVPAIDMAEYGEDQLDEDPEIQRMIDDVQVVERRYVSPMNSPIKEDRDSNDYVAAVGESVAQARQEEEIQIRASERTYDFLQAGGQYPLIEHLSSDTLADSPEQESTAIPETVQDTPSAPRTPARPIMFSPIRHGRDRMQDQPRNVQLFYRGAV